AAAAPGRHERGANFASSRAAILGEKDEQVAHRGKVDRVDDRAAVAPRANETGVREKEQLCRHGVGSGVERARDFTRREPFRTRLDEETEDVETRIVRERGKLF